MDDEFVEFVRGVRRRIHRCPEVGHEEWTTAQTVETTLRSFGLDPFRPAPTSVAVLIGPSDKPPAVGLRADLDALRIDERNDVPYRSEVAGVMHACGHDGHAAALLGLARLLSRLSRLTRGVLLVFQQAEETYPSGAPLVIDGLPDALWPDRFYAFHLWPQLPHGVIGARPGPMLGALAALDVEIVGRQGRAHGTEADAGGSDALQAGVALYQRLREAIPNGRRFASDQPSMLNIGMLEGGSAHNTVATSCWLRAVLRSLSRDEQRRAIDTVQRIVDDVAIEAGVTMTATFNTEVRPPVDNDLDAVDALREACSLAGVEYRNYPDEAVGVTDDFGWFTGRRPGALAFVGCGDGPAHPDLHTPMFDFDERVLLAPIRVGLQLACGAAGDVDAVKDPDEHGR
jgi:amidohydrolase